MRRVYNYREWGGLLTYYGKNLERKIGLDGRLYLYSKDMFQDYMNEALGHVSISKLEELYNPDAMFLHSGYHSALIDLVKKHSNWELVCQDGESNLYIHQRLFLE